MSRNLPCLVHRPTVLPTSACRGGSYVLSAPIERSLAALIACPCMRSVRPPASALTSGNSGMAPWWRRSSPVRLRTYVEFHDLEVDVRRHRGQQHGDAKAAARRALRWRSEE